MQRGPRCAVTAAREDLRPPLSGFRESEIGVIFLADFVSASIPPRISHGNSVSHRPQPDILRNSSFLTLGRPPRKILLWVELALPARGSAST